MMLGMAKSASGGHGVGVTKNRVVRVSDDLWSRAQRKAEGEGLKLSEVIRRLLAEYVGEKDVRTMDTPERAEGKINDRED